MVEQVMNYGKFILKSYLKKKLKLLLIPVGVFLAKAILVVALLIVPSVIISEAFDTFFAPLIETITDFIKGRDSDMRALMDNIGADALASFPFSEDVVDEIIRSETDSLPANQTIYIEKRTNETDVTRYLKGELDAAAIVALTLQGAKIDTSSSSVYDIVTLKSVTSDYIPYVLNYRELSYDYRVPWQLVYGLTVLSTFFENEYDLVVEQSISSEETSADGSADGDKPVLDVSKEEVIAISDALQPTMVFYNDLFVPGFSYSNDGIASLTDLYEEDLSRNDMGDSTVIKYPKLLLQSVNSYFVESGYSYERSVEYSGIYSTSNKIYVMKNSSSLNPQKLVTALELIGAEPSDADLLIPIINELPGGEELLFTLEPVLYELSYGGYGAAFNPNIPTIVGDWTRQDLVEVAKSLQGLDYFFGAKYLGLGSNPNWGTSAYQTINGSGHVGEWGRLGLDCSGFVDWVYYQMTQQQMSVGSHGTGTQNLWVNSTMVLEENLKAGDLGFYQYGGGKHVGIYIGKLDGSLLFIHAGGSNWSDALHPWGQVAITKNYSSYNGFNQSKFKYFRRLPCSFIEVD